MNPWQRAALGAGALLVAAAAAPACELVLSEHRSARELARLPLNAQAPAARIAFTHSVLGTPVADEYVWRAARAGSSDGVEGADGGVSPPGADSPVGALGADSPVGALSAEGSRRPSRPPIWRAHLVEERFEGEGYGLPYAAAAGELLTRDGPGWRLRLDRLVHPLVVRPLPSQAMRVSVGSGAPLHLATLSRNAIELRVEHCRAP